MGQCACIPQLAARSRVWRCGPLRTPSELEALCRGVDSIEPIEARRERLREKGSAGAADNSEYRFWRAKLFGVCSIKCREPCRK
jgi:hypothetical protein